MRNRRNFYRILGVQSDAPVEVVKASYRAIMHRLKMHPDLGGDHEHAALINEAFATLTNPLKRAEYDRHLGPLDDERSPKSSASSAPASSAPVSSDPPSLRPAKTHPPVATWIGAPASQTPICVFCHVACSPAQLEWPEGVCSACGSPLFLATKHRDGEDARRAIGRVPRNMPVTFWLSTAGPLHSTGITDDLSLNGMRFLSKTEIPVDAHVRIECDFCSAVAIVRSVRPDSEIPAGGWHCGVEFLTLRLKHARGGIFSTVA